MTAPNPVPPAFSLFSSDTIEGLRQARADADIARSDEGRAACACAEAAVAAADAGRMEEAGQAFDALRTQTTDLRLLFLAFQFHFRRSEWDNAEWFVRRRLELAAPESTDASRAYTNLGLIQHFRGENDAAEASQRRALDIDGRLGNDEGVARDLGNLALIPESRGDFDLAAKLYQEALEIAERVGAKAIIATKLTNLGDIALARGKRDQARELWTRAVALFGELGQEKYRVEYIERLERLPATQTPSPPGQ
jgi:tetratricopeptide (TPR) repeat protein